MVGVATLCVVDSDASRVDGDDSGLGLVGGAVDGPGVLLASMVVGGKKVVVAVPRRTQRVHKSGQRVSPEGKLNRV